MTTFKLFLFFTIALFLGSQQQALAADSFACIPDETFSCLKEIAIQRIEADGFTVTHAGYIYGDFEMMVQPNLILFENVCRRGEPVTIQIIMRSQIIARKGLGLSKHVFSVYHGLGFELSSDGRITVAPDEIKISDLEGAEDWDYLIPADHQVTSCYTEP